MFISSGLESAKGRFEAVSSMRIKEEQSILWGSNFSRCNRGLQWENKKFYKAKNAE